MNMRRSWQKCDPLATGIRPLYSRNQGTGFFFALTSVSSISASSHPALQSLLLLALFAGLFLLDPLGGLLVRAQLLLVGLGVLAGEVGLTLEK